VTPDFQLGREVAEQNLAPGFFGKLPSHGDFINRRVPSRLLGPWETWLDAGLQQSREFLGDAWLETYLSSPIWCFCGSAGCCGDRPFCGVLMPSLDRLGRYYPLSILAPLCARDLPSEIATGATEWFHQMETLALSCLSEGFDFAAFDAQLAAAPLPTIGENSAAVLEALLPEAGPAPVIGHLLGRLLERCEVCYSLWWTSGSRTIAACCRAYPGLPPTEEFARLLG
jgi:type VI secretion system protein ImpM